MGILSVGLSAKLVMRFGFRLPLATGLLLAARRAAALRARAGRRDLRRRRPPEHDPARPRRRHGVQPGAARRDERRRAERGGARLGRRQHLVHDGRRARARRARQPRRLAHARRRDVSSPRSPAATTPRSSLGALFAAAAAGSAARCSAPAPTQPGARRRGRASVRPPTADRSERSIDDVQGQQGVLRLLGGRHSAREAVLR